MRNIIVYREKSGDNKMNSRIKAGKMKTSVDRILEKRVRGIEQFMLLTNRRV